MTSDDRFATATSPMPENVQMTISTEVVFYDDLSDAEKEWQPNNGSGKSCATYLRVYRNSVLIATYSDAMEPEDAVFFRDLSWISGALEEAYERGLEDGRQEDKR